MDQIDEKRRRNTEYVQAVLNTGGPLMEWSVAVTGSGESARYWVIGPGRKVLKPSVSKAELTTPNRRVKSLISLGSRYAELVAFHQSTSSDEDPQLELTYRRQKAVVDHAHKVVLRNIEELDRPQKVVMNRAHLAILRNIEDQERTAGGELQA